MPKYRVTSPDGRTFDVTAPTGVTADDVMAYVRQQAESAQPSGPPKIGAEAFPETFREVYRAAPVDDQMLAAFGTAPRNIFEALRQIDPVPTADQQAIQANRVMAQESPGSAIAGNVATFLPTAAIPGANTLTGAALIGGGIGLLQPADSVADRATNVGMGAVAGPVGTLAGRSIAAVGKGAKALKDPFTRKGQDYIAGKTLERFAGDKTAAARNMAAASELVPGAAPTAAEVAQDAGIAQLQRALSNADPQLAAEFTARRLAQDTARLDALRGLSGTELDRELMRAVRDYMSGPLYQSAIAKGVDPKMAQALAPQIQSLLSRPSIKQAIVKAKDLAAEQGIALDDIGSVQGLHYVKLALDDMLGTAKTSGLGKTAERAIVQTKDDLLTVIDELSPDYAQARKAFASWSKPINQMEVAQYLYEKLRPALADAGASSRMRSGSFADAMRDSSGTVVKRATGFGRSSLDDVMRPEQMDLLNRLTQDLGRRTFADEAGRAVGSNTAQNLASQNLLRQIVGPTGMPESWAENTLLMSLVRPLQWAAKMGEPKIQNALADALLNPQRGAELMSRAYGPSFADRAGRVVSPYLPGVAAGVLPYGSQQ